MSLSAAQRMLAGGQYAEAHARLDRITGDPRTAIIRAAVHEAEGRLDLALEVTAQAKQQFPAHPPVHLFHGIYAYDSGDLPLAGEELSAVLQMQPANVLAKSYLALVKIAGGDMEAGNKLLRGSIESDNRMFMVRLTEWAEEQWLQSNRFFYPSAITLEDTHPGMGKRTRIRHANRCFHKQQYKELLRLIDPLTRVEHPDEGIVYVAALAAEMLFDYERAMKYIEVLGKELPDPIRAVKARCLVRFRRWAEAADELKQVLIIGPDDFGINYFLGVLCLSHGEKTRARKCFLRAYTGYIVDSLDYQLRQLQTALFHRADEPPAA